MEKAKAALNPEKTRELLLEAGKQLFARKGFDATTVKELADHAGVNASLVSYHFGGKEGLYRTCIEQFGKHRLAVAERVLQAPSSAEEFRVRLGMFIQDFLACHVEEPEIAKIIHRECELEWSIVPDIFSETFLKAFGKMIEFCVAAQKKGIVREDMDPMIATSSLFGSMAHFSRMDAIGERYFNVTLKDPKHRERVVDHLSRAFLEGVLSK